MGDKIKLSKLIRRLNLKSKTLIDRIILQKTFYLLKCSSLDLGYFFNFYLRGPYSPDLTRDLFELDLSPVAVEPEFSYEEKCIIRKVEKILAGHEKDAFWLELLASILYLYFEVNLTNKEDIFNEISKRKTYFSDKTVFNKAWLLLKEDKLIPE